MYIKGKKFTGKLGGCVSDLVKNGFFKLNTEVLSWAPVVGYIYGRKESCEPGLQAAKEKDDVNKSVSGEQVQQDLLDFILRLLVIREQVSVSDEKIDDLKRKLFESREFDDELMQNFELYINGGILVMHEQLCADFEVWDDQDPEMCFARLSKMVSFWEEVSRRAQEMN